MSLRRIVSCSAVLLILAAGVAAGQEEKRELHVRWRQGPRGGSDSAYRLAGIRFKSIWVNDLLKDGGHLVGRGELRLQMLVGYHPDLEHLDILMFTVAISNHSSVPVSFSPLLTELHVQTAGTQVPWSGEQLPVLDPRRVLSLPGMNWTLGHYLGVVRFVTGIDDESLIKIPPGGKDTFGMFFAAPERKGQKLLLIVTMMDPAWAYFEFPWP